ncbi:hypothetical protein [Pseudomonas syringae]|uniref:hypothetical protein n=1 Tax=Pseudomonas syringae TaxID=317 RepID=UPI001F0DE6E4|nr:hypothetical protein [Pseudomonas syringae]MCH5522171.1 hypothetical protein [Pseudomonas syringae pv. lapsa]
MRLGMDVRIRFHGVGQGLFSSGSICPLPKPGGSAFNWVYDCGTDSAQHYLDSSLSDLDHSIRTPGGQRPYLDLVTISHFDSDHISGLVKLLQRFDVGDLLLPYVPLWQRLVIGFHAHRAHSSRLTRFLVNPVAFIAAVPEAKVKRILFVSGSPSIDESPPERDGPPRRPLQLPVVNDKDADPQDSGSIPVKVETEDLNGLSDVDDKRSDCENMVRAAGKLTNVAFITYGTGLVIAGCWEFLPYNDAQLAPMASRIFRDRVSHLRGKLLGSVKAVTTRALKELKDLYGKEFNFKGQKENQNLISLFLYGGPIGSKLGKMRAWGSEVGRPLPPQRLWYVPISIRKGGVLYTGDGYLNTPLRFDSMQAFLGAHRVSGLSFLQVMHHGAKANWHAGLADKIKPMFSVFSSNPDHRGYRHPHTEVTTDFSSYRPLQASKGSAVNIALFRLR